MAQTISVLGIDIASSSFTSSGWMTPGMWYSGSASPGVHC